jgi:MFS family permease
VIVIGLLLFAARQLCRALAPDIWWTIAGRVLQGAGAISAAVTALAADLTREQHRTKVMAMIGSSIGLVFALSLVAAPACTAIGMGGLFWMTGGAGDGRHRPGAHVVPPAPPPPGRGPSRRFATVLLDAACCGSMFGIFVLHMVQMAMFVVVPTRW